LTDLLAEIPTDVLPFGGVVVDTSLRRRLVLLARDLEAAAYAPVSSADEVLAEHLRRVTEIVQDRLLRAIS
jgi:replicative DNA helicase